MAQSADSVPVFAKVERIERAEGLEALAAGHGEDRDGESTRPSLARSLARSDQHKTTRTLPFFALNFVYDFRGPLRNQFINSQIRKPLKRKRVVWDLMGCVVRGTNTKTREDAEHEH